MMLQPDHTKRSVCVCVWGLNTWLEADIVWTPNYRGGSCCKSEEGFVLGACESRRPHCIHADTVTLYNWIVVFSKEPLWELCEDRVSCHHKNNIQWKRTKIPTISYLNDICRENDLSRKQRESRLKRICVWCHHSAGQTETGGKKQRFTHMSFVLDENNFDLILMLKLSRA